MVRDFHTSSHISVLFSCFGEKGKQGSGSLSGVFVVQSWFLADAGWNQLWDLNSRFLVFSVTLQGAPFPHPQELDVDSALRRLRHALFTDVCKDQEPALLGKPPRAGDRRGRAFPIPPGRPSRGNPRPSSPPIGCQERGVAPGLAARRRRADVAGPACRPAGKCARQRWWPSWDLD